MLAWSSLTSYPPHYKSGKKQRVSRSIIFPPYNYSITTANAGETDKNCLTSFCLWQLVTNQILGKAARHVMVLIKEATPLNTT